MCVCSTVSGDEKEWGGGGGLYPEEESRFNKISVLTTRDQQWLAERAAVEFDCRFLSHYNSPQISDRSEQQKEHNDHNGEGTEPGTATEKRVINR